MKRLLTSVFALVFTFSVWGQTNLTTAVDFTVTDYEGNVHNLFDYLDNGQMVALYFFFNS